MGVKDVVALARQFPYKPGPSKTIERRRIRRPPPGRRPSAAPPLEGLNEISEALDKLYIYCRVHSLNMRLTQATAVNEYLSRAGEKT